MRDFLNYGDSLDIKFLIITILFIVIWKIFIEKKIKERLEAKQKGDYKLADEIRVELASKGVIIEDKKEQTTWKFK